MNINSKNFNKMLLYNLILIQYKFNMRKKKWQTRRISCIVYSHGRVFRYRRCYNHLIYSHDGHYQCIINNKLWMSPCFINIRVFKITIDTPILLHIIEKNTVRQLISITFGRIENSDSGYYFIIYSNFLIMR